MSLEFTLVRRAISLAVIDGPDAGDNPDILQAQGSVLFEPVIKKGDSIQVQTRGGSETYALAPIECPINDGIISHRGQDGVKLPAGGEAANPPLIRWKATFSRMQAGGKSFTLAPVIFDAVPGGEIDLTMVAPVAGAPEGVVRGPRGTSLESIIVDGSELVFTAVDDAGSFEIARIPLDEMVRAEAEAAADGVRDELAVDVAASQAARDAAEGHANRAATSETNAAASESNAKQSEVTAGDYAAVATTAATEAVDAMESTSEAATAIPLYAEQVQTARDEVVPLAGQVAADASATAAHREHVDSQVSAIDTAFTESIPPYLQPSGAGGLQEIYGRAVHVKTFGAVGDGIADDTAALRSAIVSGRALYWGNSGDTYRVTDSLVHNVSHPLTWTSDGATVYCDPATPVRRVIFIVINGQPVSIQGPLSIDAHRKAFIGFALDSAADRIDAEITGLSVSNVYRSSNEHVGGDGILIRGGFNTLTLNRPIVKSVTMADGTALSEPNGVAGISVSAFDSERSPLDIQINAPFVDGVMDENPDNPNSQNGIRIYGPSDAANNPSSTPMKFHISGGMIRNAGGRAVKVQCEWGVVDGLKIIRDAPRVLGKSDIDFQRGGGQISNLSVQYEGNAAAEIVKFSGPATSGKLVPHGSIAGMKVTIMGEQSPQTVVNFLQDDAAISYVSLSDVEVVGGQVPYVLTLNGVSGMITNAALNSIFSHPTMALVRGTGGTVSGWTGSVGAVNCTNTGEEGKPLYLSTSGLGANPQVSGANISGFTGVDTNGRAVLHTVSDTTVGWNNLYLASGFGSVYSPSYYRPPGGTYRITYLGREEKFERFTHATGRGEITPAGGVTSEVVQFAPTDYFRIPGQMTDLRIIFERLL